MILRTKPITVDAIPFSDLDAGYREEWVTRAIEEGEIYMQGGADPYWTVKTLLGTAQMRLGDWLVRRNGDLIVYSERELWAHYEYHDPGQR